MMYKMRKKAQKMLNKKIRLINKAIEKDNLWMGRFEIRQKDASWNEFSDGSGGELFATLRFYDKGSGYYKDFIVSALYPDSGIFLFANLNTLINEFIINDCGVWEENPSPRDAKSFVKDYTKIHISDSIMNKEMNYHKIREVV